jgi:hypothetical protein
MKDLLASTFDPAPYVGWARSIVRLIKDGGMWAVPMNSSAYRFDHKAKRLTLVLGPKDDLFDRTCAVFELLGYEVTADPNRPQS